MAESSLTVRAELSALRRDLQSAGGLTEGKAESMVIALDKRLKAAESAAKKVVKAQKDATKAQGDWNKALESAQQTAASLPGPLGQIAGTVAAASKGMGGLAQTAGAAGTSIGIATAAVALLAVGAVKGAQAIDGFVDSADDAVDRLEAIGAAGMIPPETIAAIERYESASRAAGVGADMLRARIGGLVAGAFEPMIASLAGIVAGLDDMTPSVRLVTGLISDFQTVSRGVAAVVSLGGSELARYVTGLDDLADAGREAAAELAHLERVQKLLNASVTAGEKVAQIQADALLAMTGASDAQVRLLRETEAIDAATAEYATALQAEVAALREKLAEDERAGRIMGEAAEQQRQLIAETESYNATLIDAAGRSAEVRKQQVASAVAAEEAEKRLAEAMRKAEEAERKQADAAREVNDQLKEEKEQTEAARKEWLAKWEVHQRVTEAEREQSAATARLKDEIDAANLSIQQTVAEMDRVYNSATLVIEAWAAWGEQALNSPVVQALEGIGSKVQQLQDQQIAYLQEQAQEQVGAARDSAEAWAEAQEQRIADLLATGAITEGQAAAERQRIDEQLNQKLQAADTLANDERQRALRAFRASQNLQRAAAIVEAARAAISLIPAFAFLGPFAPMAAAGVAGAALGTQLAIIDNAQPPEFPMGISPGNSPDHQRMVALQDEELVASKRASRMPEVADAIDRGNRGERPRPQGSQDEIGVRVSLDPRMKRLRISTDRRVGKRPAAGRR